MSKKSLAKKIKRYIELSTEFEKDAKDLFDVEPQNKIIWGHSHCSGTVTLSTSPATCYAPQSKTRAEVIREEAEVEAKRAERYDEYLELRQSLSQYVSGILAV